METLAPDSLVALLMAPKETLSLPLPPPQIVKNKTSQLYAPEKLKFSLKLNMENIFFDTLLLPVEEMKRMLTSTLQEKVSIWGVPLLKDNRKDVVLLKFLRARYFQVEKAFKMLRKIILWRKEFNVDNLVMSENLENVSNKVMFIHGRDKEGSLIFYYNMMFVDKENNREKFLRCWIQSLEKSIRKLDFSPGGNSTFFQVNDVKKISGFRFKEHRIVTTKALQLIQENYPALVAKQVFINVPWWYMGFYKMISTFLSRRTKEKFAFASASESAENLLKHISPEHLPIQYGGFGTNNLHEDNKEFNVRDPATVITLNPGSKEAIEIVVNHNEICHISWELRVIEWEVNYCVEYVPKDDSVYNVIIDKARKIVPSDELVISSIFKMGYEDKIVLTINNSTSDKKKVIYRSKVTLCPPVTEF